MHVDTSTTVNHNELAFSTFQSTHSDISFSSVWLKEQRSSRFNQENTLHYLDGILNTALEELPRLRVFQFASFISPLIEDFITTNLETVVLLN